MVLNIARKKKVAIVICIAVSLVLLTIVLINSYTVGAVKLEDKFIAHAGGEINGVTYTNSLEAVELSIESGYKYIELDLVVTSDSMIIAAHYWTDFNRLTGFEMMGDSTLSYEEAMSRKIKGNGVLDAKGIVDIFKKNPDVIFVTDKLDDTELLSRYFSEIKEQMMVEAFSIDAYFELKSRGFIPMLAVGSYFYEWLLTPSNWTRGSVDWIVTGFSWREHIIMYVSLLFGVNIAVATINDYELSQELNSKASLIYTGNLLHKRDSIKN